MGHPRRRVVAGPEVRQTRLDSDTEAVALYVVSEALANTAKHAEATEAVVRIALADGVLEVVVSDDGTGFEPPARPTGGGLGNMRDRVSALGGRLLPLFLSAKRHVRSVDTPGGRF